VESDELIDRLQRCWLLGSDAEEACGRLDVWSRRQVTVSLAEILRELEQMLTELRWERDRGTGT
jgi:hypothetical protein